MDLQPGNVIDNRYVVEAEIGRGGMAAVYRVRHAQLGTLAALKVLTMPAASIQERLLHEGRVQAALQHPNIVTVSDVVIHNGAPGLVMEYVRGPSLDDFLIKRRLTVGQADEIAAGVLAGVRAAHNHGLIHRDLKPANIMLAITDSGLIPKVADFGLVKMLEGDAPSMSKTRSGVAMGTPAYMAPEQISDAKNVDYRADIFSLGAILYELVTNIRAFDHDDMFQTFSAIMSANFTPLRELKPDLPERMERAILGALHTERDERIQTVSDLLAIWKGEMGEDGVLTNTSSLWGAEFLSEVSSMGAGGETSAESLRRSMKSGMGRQDVAGQTAAPHPNDLDTRMPKDAGNTQATMAPIPGMFAEAMQESAQQKHPDARKPVAEEQEEETTLPPVVVAPVPSAAPTGGLGVLAIAGLGLFVGTLGIGAIGAALYVANNKDPVIPDPEPVVDPAPVPDPDPVQAPDPDPVPDPTPTTPDPEPSVPTPQPQVPEPRPDPQPEPTPVPEPEPQPEPEPVPEPQPEPEPAVPDPEPVPVPVPTKPLVYLDTNGVTVRFYDANNSPVPVNRLQGGAQYKIMAVWNTTSEPSVIKAAYTFKNGKNYQIKCNPGAKKCILK